MRKYVKRFIDCCLPCAYNKVPSGKKSGLLNIIEKIATPMDTLHIDHLGPFVMSSKRNSYLIVAVDGYTKFVFMKPVRNAKIGPVINFMTEIFNIFGSSRRIICDRGSCFTSKEFTKFCDDLNIKRILNATATPRANGQVERYNRTILSSIATMTENELKWDCCISSICFGLNSTVNKSTGKTPYELVMGYVPRSLNDSYISNELCNNDIKTNVVQNRQSATENIKIQQKLQKKYYDSKRVKSKKFEINDLVVVKKLITSNDGKSKKLLPKYSGPYIIVKILDFDRYLIEDLPGSKRSQKKYSGIVPSDKIKLYNVNKDESSDSDYSDNELDNESRQVDVKIIIIQSELLKAKCLILINCLFSGLK